MAEMLKSSYFSEFLKGKISMAKERFCFIRDKNRILLEDKRFIEKREKSKPDKRNLELCKLFLSVATYSPRDYLLIHEMDSVPKDSDGKMIYYNSLKFIDTINRQNTEQKLQLVVKAPFEFWLVSNVQLYFFVIAKISEQTNGKEKTKCIRIPGAPIPKYREFNRKKLGILIMPFFEKNFNAMLKNINLELDAISAKAAEYTNEAEILAEISELRAEIQQCADKKA